MTDMHDDAARQIVHQLRARMFTDTLSGCPATPSRYFETAERLAPVLDVQAVRGGALDGGDLIHVGDVALPPLLVLLRCGITSATCWSSWTANLPT